jgi:DnaK suppressor protein
MALTREQRIELEQELRKRERALDHAEISRDAGELRAIGRALQAVREGEYGHCADCGADIPVERLRLEPSALRCVRCQTLCARNFAHPQPGPSP